MGKIPANKCISRPKHSISFPAFRPQLIRKEQYRWGLIPKFLPKTTKTSSLQIRCPDQYLPIPPPSSRVTRSGRQTRKWCTAVKSQECRNEPPGLRILRYVSSRLTLSPQALLCLHQQMILSHAIPFIWAILTPARPDTAFMHRKRRGVAPALFRAPSTATPQRASGC